VPAFDGVRLNGIQHLKPGDDLAAGMHADLELAAGHGRHRLGEDLAATEDGVETLGEAGGEAPADIRQGLGKRRRRQRCAGGAGGCLGKEGSTLHESVSW
jgi:hypothetical protein